MPNRRIEQWKWNTQQARNPQRRCYPVQRLKQSVIRAVLIIALFRTYIPYPALLSIMSRHLHLAPHLKCQTYACSSPYSGLRCRLETMGTDRYLSVLKEELGASQNFTVA